MKDATGQAPAYARETRADADTTKLPKPLPRKLMAHSLKHWRRIGANIVFASTSRACRECVPNSLPI